MQKQQVGLWIDHKTAVLVFLNGEKKEVKEIESNLEKHTHASGGSRSKSSYGPEDVVAEDRRERNFKEHLNQYYEQVLASIGEVESILIFGPGLAKNELKKRIKNKEMQQRVEELQTVDKMTTPQIVAKVQEYFAKKPSKK